MSISIITYTCTCIPKTAVRTRLSILYVYKAIDMYAVCSTRSYYIKKKYCSTCHYYNIIPVMM